MDYSEKQIEKKLVSAVRKSGGLALKFVSPGYDGVPDRLILIAYGKVGFVEVKAPSKKPRALQLKRHRDLRKLGFKVYVLDNPDDIEKTIDEIKGVDSIDI